MAYYLQSSAASTGYIQLDTMAQGVGGGATRISWDIEFEAIRNGTDFIPVGRNVDSNLIVFLKSDNSFELRVRNQTFNASAATMGIAGTNTRHKYKLQHREVNTTYETTLFVDDVQIVTWTLDGADQYDVLFDRLFSLGSSTRHGGIWYYSYTDNITAANSRYYSADASGGTGAVLPETTLNGTDGTQGGTWAADNSEWVDDGVAAVPDVTLGAGEALVAVTDPVTDTTSIFNQLASGTIATGDYVHHTDSPNTVVNADGTFTQTVDGNFDARVWDATDETWGQWVTIEVNPVGEVVDEWPFSKGIRPAGPVTWKYGNRHPTTQMRVRMKK